MPVISLQIGQRFKKTKFKKENTWKEFHTPNRNVHSDMAKLRRKKFSHCLFHPVESGQISEGMDDKEPF